jgi:CoA:oxalate CoA-transferase
MEQKKALMGIKVLDMGRVLSGPLCAAILGDFGADVIKVEMPGTGDDSRANKPYGGYFACFNRNKKSVTLDLKQGREQFLKLVSRVDVLVENFRPGVMEKLGFGYDELKKINPGLIYCAISGFGQTGPYSQRACFDPVAQAMAGIMSVTGFPGTRPVRCGASICDVMAAQNAALGILVALQYRSKTGEGQIVDIALVDMGVTAMSSIIQNYLSDGYMNTKMGNGYVAGAPGGSYHAKDGEFILNASADKSFAKLCGLMKREDLLKNIKFSNRKARCENRDELDDIINAWTVTKTIEEHVQTFLGLKMVAGPVYNVKQTTEDPQIAGVRGMFPEVEVVGTGKFKITGQPIKMSETPANIYHNPPALGEDNTEVYRSLGYDDSEIKAMSDKHII